MLQLISAIKNVSRIICVATPILMLAGCGSDNEKNAPTPEVPPVEESKKPHESFNLDIIPDSKFSGNLTLYLGPWFPCSELHPEYCNSNGGNIITTDDKKYVMTIQASELKRYMRESTRSDIFAEGQYSMLDLMLYVSSIRPDLDINLLYFNTETNSYDFETTFNNEAVPSKNWYANFLYDPGESMRTQGIPRTEVIYNRMDEFILRDDMIVRFQPFSNELTQRREQIFKDEVNRKNSYGDKVVVPFLQVDFGDGRGYVTVAKDIEVKPYNTRRDLFKEDVLTIVDVVLSAVDNHDVDFEFTFWPTLATNTKYESYAVTSIEGKRATGLMGWTTYIGEFKADKDFYYYGANLFPSLNDLIEEVPPYQAKCNWLRDRFGKLDERTATICVDEFNAAFSGNLIHRSIDTFVLQNPTEAVKFRWHASMASKWGTTDHNVIGDGKYPTYEISDLVAPLTSSHFGWNVADCGLCHKIEETHLSGDSPALPDTVEPYFCASCHGSNGAPKGHGEISYCFQCHSKDKAMTNHGDASLTRFIGDVDCSGYLAGESGPCSNVAEEYGSENPPIRDKAGNHEVYDSKLQTLGNSSWHTSTSFPDPYSCVTCHPN